MNLHKHNIMNALLSYIRHVIVAVILLIVEKSSLPLEGAEDAANLIALVVTGTISWLAVKYIAPLIKFKSKTPVALIAISLCALSCLGLVSCAPTSYTVNTVKYADAIAENPASVVFQAEDVEPSAATDFRGGLTVLTDLGVVGISDDGVNASLVVDRRSGK